MSSPYRDGSGTPCPRCGAVMLADDRGDLACADGCGIWIGRPALDKLLDVTDLHGGPRVPYWKATPLPETRCLGCERRLDDLYVELNHRVLALGKCVEHGMWVEAGTRAEFETAYRAAIEKHARAALPPPPPGSDRERIERLETRIAMLERTVAVLVERVPSRWFDDD